LLALSILVVAADAPVTAAAIAPGGKSFLVGSQSGLEVRSWPDLAVTRAIPSTLAHVHDLAFGPQLDCFAAVGGTPGESGELEIWSWPSQKRLVHAKPHQDLVYRVEWRADGKQLACASSDHTVSLIDLVGGEDLRVTKLAGHSRAVTSLTFLPGDRYLVTASLDETLRVWDLTSHKVVRSLTNHTAGIRDIALRPRSESGTQLLASAGADRTVRLWDPLTGRMVRFARLPSEPLDVDWTPDGARLVVGCVDGRVRLIDCDTVEVAAEHHGVDGWAYVVAVAATGSQVLVGGSRGQLRIIESRLGR
jgi:WD40 repeat protein